MVICDCGKIHVNRTGKDADRLKDAINEILSIKGEFQNADACERIALEPARVNNLIGQLKRFGYIEVAGAALNKAGTRACLTYKVVRKPKKGD